MSLWDLLKTPILLLITLSEMETRESTQHEKPILRSFIKIIIVSCLIIGSLSYLYVLPDRLLYQVYYRVVIVCIITFSYWLNTLTLNDVYELQNLHFIYLLFCNVILESFLSLVFGFLQDFPTNQSIHLVFSFCFAIPTLIIIALLPGTMIHGYLNTVQSALLPLLLNMLNIILQLNLYTITNLICNKYSYIRETIRMSTWSDLFLDVVEVLDVEWNRFKMPTVLRLFWAIQALEQILYLITDEEIQNETLYEALKMLLIKGFDIFTLVLGMISFVSNLSHCIEAFFGWVLTDEMDDGNIDTTFSVSFCVLTLRTELTGLDPEKLFIILYHNSCLIFVVLLHYFQDYVATPLLMSLSAYHNPSLHRHLRALLVSGFLIVFPITVFTHLWSHHSVSTWPITVTSFIVVISIKSLVSSLVYLLYFIDAYRTTFWEKLDDYVFYIKLFENMIEFCFYIYHFLIGVYAIAFNSDGVVQTFAMCMNLFWDSYRIIWCGARNGWKKFIERRTAVKKIEFFPDATSVALAELNDVCAICCQNMVSAKITRCNHYFHFTCLLRNELFVNNRDRCPVCRCNMYTAAVVA